MMKAKHASPNAQDGKASSVSHDESTSSASQNWHTSSGSRVSHPQHAQHVAGAKEGILNKFLTGRLGTILIAVVLVVGRAIMLYPSISDWWNSKQASYAVDGYVQASSALTEEERSALISAAAEWNEELITKGEVRWVPNDEERSRYEGLLAVPGTDIMCAVEVPTLGVSLPVYHGAEESNLQVGAGHLEGSSLPIGGSSTHCVISGHTGLPSAKLFTDIDQLKEGDLFCLRVLGEELWYEVDNIAVVEPANLSLLQIEENQDLCTLVTCTPYGVNSHRLLVRGHRTDAPTEPIASDAAAIPAGLIALIVAGIAAIAAVVIYKVKKRKGLQQ